VAGGPEHPLLQISNGFGGAAITPQVMVPGRTSMKNASIIAPYPPGLMFTIFGLNVFQITV
jgi:hypothetical protein